MIRMNEIDLIVGLAVLTFLFAWLFLGGGMHRVLVLLRLRPDWTKPENAPPAFEGILPHAYNASICNEKVCRECGGGSRHPIHRGGR